MKHATFHVRDALANALIAFDDRDYGKAAEYLRAATTYAERMKVLQDDMNTMAAELDIRIESQS